MSEVRLGTVSATTPQSSVAEEEFLPVIVCGLSSGVLTGPPNRNPFRESSVSLAFQQIETGPSLYSCLFQFILAFAQTGAAGDHVTR